MELSGLPRATVNQNRGVDYDISTAVTKRGGLGGASLHGLWCLWLVDISSFVRMLNITDAQCKQSSIKLL